MRRQKPKFAVGDTVTYAGNRRLRRVVRSRYWDPRYPSWRYRLNETKLSKELAAAWAVIETELLLVKTA